METIFTQTITLPDPLPGLILEGFGVTFIREPSWSYKIKCLQYGSMSLYMFANEVCWVPFLCSHAVGVRKVEFSCCNFPQEILRWASHSSDLPHGQIAHKI